MGKPLSEELIKQKTRQDSLNLIRNLNLWGQDIDDLKVLKGMPNLEVLSLSVNKITTLRDIAYCHKLQELYLRKNSISDISEIRYLSPLKDLKVLWLSDNPCATIKNYRDIVIKSLPYLEKLDNVNITNEDKINSQNIDIDFIDNNVSNGNGNNKGYQSQQSQQYDPSPVNNNKNYDQYNNNNQLYNNNENNQISSNYVNQQSTVRSSQMNSQYQMKSNNNNLISNNSAVNNNNYQQSNYDDGQIMNNASQIDDQMVNRNSNIVCAILSLVKELDYNSLEIIRRDVERKISSLHR